MSCKPVLTPADCAPVTAQIDPGPAVPPPTSTPAHIPVHPVAPPIFGDGPDSMLFGGMLPIPEDLTWSRVLDWVSAIGVVSGVVLVLAIGLVIHGALRAWSPARMRNWTLAVLLGLPAATALTAWDLGAPTAALSEGFGELLDGRYVHGAAVASVLVIPVAWLLATIALTSRRVQLLTHGLQSPARTERAMWLHAEREQRAAGRLSRYRLPFTTGGLNPHIVIGRLAVEDSAAPPKGRLRMLLSRNETRLIIPWINLREHITTVASSGKGKTTLMLRLLLSWHTTAWMRHRQWWRTDRPGRPLTMVIDCNGGPESVKVAHRLVRWYRALGVPAARIGIVGVPATDANLARLALWSIPRLDDLRSVLSAMISGGGTPTTDTERYFHNLRETLIHLIIDAPASVVNGQPVGENPPRDWIEFLSRFDPVKLAKLWGGVWDDTVRWSGVPGIDREIAATMAGKQPVMDSARSEFGILYRLLGDSFEGSSQITDYDLLYVILEGVKAPDRARAQFAALGCMLEQLADRDHKRETLLAVDEFSAVSDGKTRAKAWVERFRKAKIGSWWLAQSWQGLGHDDDSRTALVAAGSGGGLHGGHEFGVEKLAEGYGTKRRFDLSRKLIGGASVGDEGNVQAAEKFLMEPNKVRRMGKGDIVFVVNGVARWGRVSFVDDNTIDTVRPLPGLAEVREVAADPQTLAPVINLRKHRHA
ncbi:AAA domain-containing protein [Nocardia tenerifensis]|uniref:AAA domain-containing protein n=1 Tax=Nocardia tenerifensis TaxID=228006 RepID=A0A318K075_9NOCA|nr:AAA family ATPase [Nocardia tenerifensis]PXX52300.1 AAA domain-containing protein [Nocardia tenerifensis]